ncbi:hemerythrin family protein [Azospirillum sp. YIM DDC1]|uniref:Hemerythrin family protein n=1 Tax=Azospirillum aestuarii TaxID=2802052 RepID=A0ABS1I1J6_9PROT|nr:bacteriohemerythrin [Azospirillum aestuarii]MBK4720572.1 hemerythrin family protein [Azospirillum aestuarii]
MGVITWRRQLSVGQPSIDEDHKHLIEYLNELDAALNSRSFMPVRVAKILMKLLEYTQQHFAREEKIMQAVHYPKFEEHVRQHQEAVRTLSELSAVFTRDPTHQNAERIYTFTANWLVHHIIMQDTQLTPYVRGVWV